MESSESNLKISLNPGIDTIEIGSQYIDAGATASYGYRSLTPVVIENNVDTSTIGVYEITYHISYLEYEKSIVRMITVIDETPPVIILNSGVDTIVVGQTWIDSGAQVLDNSNEIIEVVVTNSVDLNTPGEYIVTYSATDSSGNQSEITRYVNVIEPPSL